MVQDTHAETCKHRQREQRLSKLLPTLSEMPRQHGAQEAAGEYPGEEGNDHRLQSGHCRIDRCWKFSFGERGAYGVENQQPGGKDSF